MHAALKRLRGAFALVYLFEGEENLLIGAREGAPLAVGYGEGEMYLGGTVKLAESRLGRSRVGQVNGRDEDPSRPDLRRPSLPC